ncbi:TadE/TadG family type IV pilus assembly protein [Neobacillus novalis]|uniref:TadE/TadG family type IV pilus assembly protein n=1 Tax=Neobacillus novalis TaxID=220687 RepID=A0AA95MWV2_9BACI|nr:TadE/TadG family type IV pilus assembly protein [Neobacillus novalis]WHY87708.1 TadE/TadG family type IV pilus assembly protein [Neobacillus novalis]
MRRDERGQSMVETALLLPIFLLILIGILDFGRVTYSYAHLHMAAEESVRLGGLGEKDPAISTFARKYVHLGDPAKLQVEITPKDTLRHSGDYVTVKLSYPFQFYTPFISKLFPSKFAIASDSTIRVE